MTARLRRWLGPAVGVVLLALAVTAVHRELAGMHWHDLRAAIGATSGWRWLAAAGCTALSYAALAGYEHLAARRAGVDLPPRKVWLVGVLGWAVSNSVGHAWLSGGALRMRLYGAMGVPAGAVARIVAVDALAFTAGAVTVGGTALALDPPPPLEPWGRLVGVGALLALGAAIALVHLRPGPIRVRDWSIEAPRGAHLAAFLALAAVDQLASIGALYVLLPPDAATSYPELLSLFLAALVGGLASGVPAGAGTTDGLLVAMTAPYEDGVGVLSAMLCWRLIYELVPLVLAAVTLAGIELTRRRDRLGAVGDLLGRTARTLAPTVFAALTFLTGSMLLVSAFTPAEVERLRWLERFEPLAVLETSHAGSALVGVWLLFVARGLHRRLAAAWRWLVALAVVGALVSLGKGWDWEEALVLTVVALAALPVRGEFHRRAALGREEMSVGWAVAVALAVAVAAVVLVHGYVHLPWRQDLLFEVSARAEQSRSLRAFAVAAAAACAGLVGAWLRPVRRPHPVPTAEDLADARRIAAEAGHTNGLLVGLRDKAVLFDDARTAFLTYGASHGIWVVYGEPIGPPEASRELLWALRDAADREGARIALYEIGPEVLPACVDLGLHAYKFGEEAVIALEAFTLEGSENKNHRNLLRRYERDGIGMTVLPAPEVPAVMAELRAVSDRWLADKSTSEKAFSLGFFDEDYLAAGPVAVVRDRDGRLLAFANLLVAGPELSIDLMRFDPDAPNGAMDFLFLSLLAWGRDHGQQRFVLGMTPLAGLPDNDLAPLWARLGTFVFRNGEAFYNFQGLRAYKEKFRPRWEPRYLAVQGPLALPATLRSLNALISGSLAAALPRPRSKAA
ncbi:MAG: bifunctional lysylphosphatidylglycerol flippase/synthetase MprF [Alphaproteobacteria bacterium]|nr:bifunctional lysylphosphatidylglycerol flippase/synthetase MprF [Alphaproteobacteria bacterium]